MSKRIEQALAWVSVSYALGFFVVLAHTARLGLPILDLIDSAYIWIGVPLTIVAFFSQRIWAWIRVGIEKRTASIRETLANDISSTSLKEQVDFFLDRVRAAIPFSLTNAVITRIAASMSRRFLQSKLAADAEASPRFRKHFRFASVMVVVAAAVTGLLNLVGWIVTGVTVLLVYVWFIYPVMPQSVGGGAPSPVQLVVDTSKVPQSFLVSTGTQTLPAATGSVGGATTIDLLYRTDDGFWLKGDGPPFFLAEGAVTAVVYVTARGSLK
jgi:hypothetical protein